MGAVCGMVGGLIDSADSVPIPASARTIAASVILEDFMHVIISLDSLACKSGARLRYTTARYTGWSGSAMSTIYPIVTLVLAGLALASSATAAKCDRTCLDQT